MVTLIPGETGTTYTTSGLVDGDQVYLEMISDAGCAVNPATSNTVTMDVNQNLPVSVSIAAVPLGAICAGTSVTFTATPTNEGASPAYQWKVNGSNVGTNSPTFTSTSLTNGDVVTVVLTSSEDCTSGNPATSNAVNMTVNPDLPVSVSIAADANPVCEGTIVNFTATPTNGGASPGYQWKVNGSNVGTDSPTYTSSSLNDGDVVTVELTSDATCASGNPATSAPVTMTVDPLPTASAGGSATICSNGSYTLAGGEASYSNGTISWTEDGAGSITAGANTLTPTYTAAAGDAGNPVTLTMTVTSNNTCGTATATATYTINVDPLPTASAGGNTTICSDESYTLAGGEASYSNGTILWTHNGAGSITSGANTLTPTYTAAAGDAGGKVTLTMTVTSDNNCSSATATAIYTINVSPLSPVTPGIISGTTDVCSGSTNLIYSVSAVPDATSYTWTVPSDWTIVSGQGTTSITVTAGDASGDISVTAGNSCGTSSASTLPVFSYPDVPDVPGAITGVTAICPVKTLTYSISPVSGAVDYFWTFPTNWTINSGQGSTSITVTVPSNGASGDITVIARNVCGRVAQRVQWLLLLLQLHG